MSQTMKPRIVIEVMGGVVSGVYTDPEADLEVVLVDYDNIKAGDGGAEYLTTTPWDEMESPTYKHFQDLIDANLDCGMQYAGGKFKRYCDRAHGHAGPHSGNLATAERA